MGPPVCTEIMDPAERELVELVYQTPLGDRSLNASGMTEPYMMGTASTKRCATQFIMKEDYIIRKFKQSDQSELKLTWQEIADKCTQVSGTQRTVAMVRNRWLRIRKGLSPSVDKKYFCRSCGLYTRGHSCPKRARPKAQTEKKKAPKKMDFGDGGVHAPEMDIEVFTSAAPRSRPSSPPDVDDGVADALADFLSPFNSL